MKTWGFAKQPEFWILLCTVKVYKPFNHKGTHCSGLEEEVIAASHYTNMQANPVWGFNQQPQMLQRKPEKLHSRQLYNTLVEIKVLSNTVNAFFAQKPDNLYCTKPVFCVTEEGFGI